MKPILVVQGATGIDQVPRLDELRDEVEIRFATSTDDLRAALPGAGAMLGWNFRADSLREAWDSGYRLQWLATAAWSLMPQLRAFRQRTDVKRVDADLEQYMTELRRR